MLMKYEHVTLNISFMQVFLFSDKGKKRKEKKAKSWPRLFTSLAFRFRQIVVLLQSLHEQSETGLIYK